MFKLYSEIKHLSINFRRQAAGAEPPPPTVRRRTVLRALTGSGCSREPFVSVPPNTTRKTRHTWAARPGPRRWYSSCEASLLM